ncbi:A/G-specific adenine glycosylase [Aequitasia blattaphilus]|uniref:Sugar fermentation stimulation protein homolog n=1 Tax=Aequitasia blattaphilus TaxID=2949332 RepID=A0ABT1EEK2_9FIRM|nr:A/G-specific adenine glycosylase [Aequitasia blattaphilus]MCP1103266.1 A/G-specific adenine glycosylase [Aequitasia blattaphilus]MCR8615906.1 A/G-specific adenine glycosylase [Aequitasia blattaphilus]
MKYREIITGIFIKRINRFIAHVYIGGKEEVVHVKNTGRCKELLIEGVEVFLEPSQNPNRKTKWDLIAVQKGKRLINMDSQAPNQVVKEWISEGGLFKDVTLLKPEYTYGSSRFDFYLETKSQKVLIEVKGVTLERDSVVLFPDAPSIRAVKHVQELARASKQGYETYVILVIQMQGVSYFVPNYDTHREFAEGLKEAAKEGVHVLAYDCRVERDSLQINQSVKVVLEEQALYEMPGKLIPWYRKNKRDLPWRKDPTPYHIWISEIMLQQTRVEVVKAYYKRFLEKLPTIESLAEAKEEELLKLWEGLGYYSRVRNMQKASLQILREYQGEFPHDYKELQKLKGVGSYTAGAIASLAFHLPYPAVDGNVLRVLSRVLMLEDEINMPATKKKMEELLKPVVPQNAASDFNQGLIELGAIVCLPNGEPKCQECPLNTLCKAYIRDEISSYPKKGKKEKRKIELKTIFMIRDGERIAIRKRPKTGLLAGLYEYPNVEEHLTESEVLEFLKKKSFAPLHLKKLPESKHVFSHIEWQMIGYDVRVDSLADYRGEDYIFVLPEEIDEKYAFPTAFKKYLRCD